MARMSRKQPCGLQSPRSLILTALVSAAMGVLIANPVHAQQRPDAGIILETTKEPKAMPKPAPEMGIPPAPQPALKAQPGLKVQVTAFKITGNTVFSEAALLALISDQIGKELDFDELNQVANKIAVYYRSKGYFLAQAYLPVQEIKDGVVEITVLEGRVGEVKLKMGKDARLNESTARAILSGIQPGDLISEKSLERSLLLLNDTPGAIVKSTLEPGTVVGTADTVVDLGDDGKRVSGSLEFDNWGSRYTGEYRLGASVNFNNPTGHGDLLSFRALTSDTNGSPLGRVSYVFPVSSSGTKLGMSYSSLKYTLGQEFTSLQAYGYATVASVYVLHPFIRSRNLNVFGLLGADMKRLQDHQGGLITDEKNLRMYKAGVSGDFRDAVLGGSLNTFSLAASGGNADITNSVVKALDQSVLGYHTNGTFNKLNYEYQRVQSLVGNTSLFMSISGQQASKNLASAEKFALGGPNGVRAYPVGEASADEGALLNVELRWNIPQTDFMVNGFVDGGSARLHRNPQPTDIQNTRTLSAYGLGLNMGKPGNYLLRTSVAWRGGKDMPLADTKNNNPRAWIQLTKSF